ncbi:46450_t:CDS:1 [Gigaspora margarita]|uniref:46450_t:CDS:1 n=1 Tax=Gigaspora margarita TaxID=4874 RepID=A0ABN7VTK7_GIGMA|nr:46450_t:CDS:1 [Gigaspora margarita]
MSESEPKKKRKTTKTDVYVRRINNDEFFPPTVSPVVTKSRTYDPNEWKSLNQTLQDKKKQHKIDQDWAEVYSKFIQFELIYNKVNEKTYLFENHKDKEINKLIKQSIPDGLSTEISRWRKAFDLAVLIIESNDISLEDFLVEIRDLNITFNYLQEVDKEEFQNLFHLIVEKYKKMQ